MLRKFFNVVIEILGYHLQIVSKPIVNILDNVKRRTCLKNKFYFYFQRNGHWMGDSHMGNNEGYNASDSSQRGSQAALLAVNNDRHRWPKGKDFLFSTWAFVVGKKYVSFRL